MEEEKKEFSGNEVNHEKGMHGFYHHHLNCSRQKVIKAIILGVLIFAIFSIGVCFGAHLNRGDRGNYYGHEQNNFRQRGYDQMMQRGGGRMMLNKRFQKGFGNGYQMIKQEQFQKQFHTAIPETIKIVNPKIVQPVQVTKPVTPTVPVK